MAVSFKKVAGLVLVAVASGIGLYVMLHRGLESTDDAFIESDVTTIAPRVGGTVAKVLVRENQTVEVADVLFELDPTDYTLKIDELSAALKANQTRTTVAQEDKNLMEVHTAAQVVQAEAALNAARRQWSRAEAEKEAIEADAVLAERDVKRFKSLADKDEISQQRLEQVIAQRDSVKARLEASRQAVLSAEAQVHQAEGKLQEAKTAPRQVAVKSAQINSVRADTKTLEANLAEARQALSYAVVKAPVAGRITRKAVLPGQVVQANQTVLAIVSGLPWVVANFKETQLAAMRIGQSVDIHIDAFPEQRFKGHIESLQAGTGSRFSLLPPENATGNYVKVVQRIPVKIVFDEDAEHLKLLAPGLSVVPTVHLDATP
jgi:membrane fusion protein (multidrug efflux system)